MLSVAPPAIADPSPPPTVLQPTPIGPHRLPHEQPRRGWAGEAVFVSLVVGLLSACYASLAWYGFDLLEEGYFLTHAHLVQLGGLPYRDFSTPYTPGIFYLYAWLMTWAHADLFGLRLVQVAGRAITYVCLYACARRLMPPRFAILAPLVIVLMDTAPELWGIHPGWVTTAAATLGIVAITRYVETGRLFWLVAAGAFSGLAFVFKQNLAAYGLMAALWFLVVAEGRLPVIRLRLGIFGRRRPGSIRSGPATPRRPTGAGRWLRPLGVAVRAAVQVAALALLPSTAAVIVRPYFSTQVFFLYVVPLAALSVLAGAHLVYRRPPRPGAPVALPDPGHDAIILGREVALITRPVLVLIGFGAVTLPWLVLLVRALDGRIALLSGFVGQIDPSGYFYGMKPFSIQHARLVGAVLLPPIVLVAAARVGLWSRLGASIVVLGLLVLVGLAIGSPASGATEPWSIVSGAARLVITLRGSWDNVGRLARVTDDLILYLPVLAFWGAFVALVLGADRGPRGTVRLWFLVAGAALFLNQYPRMDEIHLLWSAGPLFVAGSDVLYRQHRRALAIAPALRRSGAGHVALGLSFILLPLAACFPHVWFRQAGWVALAPAPIGEVQAAGPGGQGHLAPLSLPTGGRVWMPEDDARDIEEVVDLLQAKTAPGEPVFTYPAIPGFLYLADRPAATRFLHLFPGMASPADQQEIVRQLQQVRYVVWDDGGAHYWVQPGDNAPVTEYIRTTFRVERFIGPYAVLARDATGPQLPYVLPR